MYKKQEKKSISNVFLFFLPCLRQNKQLQKCGFTVNTFTKRRGSVHVSMYLRTFVECGRENCRTRAGF